MAGIAVLVGLAGCGEDNAKKASAKPGASPVSFAVYDQNYAPVAGAWVYVDVGPTGPAQTDSTGMVSLALSGIHDVHIGKGGYSGRSYIHRDWSGVNTQQVVRLSILLATSATGTVSGAISPTATSDPAYSVRVVRLDDGFSFNTANIPPVVTSTPYTATAFQGSNEVFLYPSSVNISPSAAYAGYAPPVAVGAAATVNLTPTVGGGVAFSMYGTNGIAGGNVNAAYAISRDPYGISTLLSNGSAGVAATALAGATLTVPPIHSVFTGPNYQLTVNSQTTAPGPRQQRLWTEIYRSYAELSAAPVAPSYTLPAFGVAVGTPGDMSFNQGTAPAFTWSMTGTPAFMEIFLTEYNAAFAGGYVQPVWQAWIYNQATATYPAVFGALAVDTAYTYNLQGRTNHLDTAGTYRGNEKDGWVNIRFGTGPTTPP